MYLRPRIQFGLVDGLSATADDKWRSKYSRRSRASQARLVPALTMHSCSRIGLRCVDQSKASILVEKVSIAIENEEALKEDVFTDH